MIELVLWVTTLFIVRLLGFTVSPTLAFLPIAIYIAAFVFNSVVRLMEKKQ